MNMFEEHRHPLVPRCGAVVKEHVCIKESGHGNGWTGNKHMSASGFTWTDLYARDLGYPVQTNVGGRAECDSVKSHHYRIFNPNAKGHRNYEGMPFYDVWNPDKGGSFTAGARWIIDNLGKRPEGCSLHIIDHEKGFVPGNLEWTHPVKQSNQQMFKIIAQQRHEIKKLKNQLICAQQVLSLL